jgi:hypothetical protein
VLDTLAQASAPPERCVGRGRSAGSQLGLGRFEVGLGGGKRAQVRCGALACVVERSPGGRDSLIGFS